MSSWSCYNSDDGTDNSDSEQQCGKMTDIEAENLTLRYYLIS